MRPVAQDRFYKPPRMRGNCVIACLATIFEVPIRSIDLPDGPSHQELCDWTREHYPALSYHEVDECYNHRIIGKEDGQDVWRYDYPEQEPRVPHAGYWIAHVVSPRVVLADGPYKGMAGLHAVVMKGATMVWDPHPKGEGGRRIGYGWWMLDDPSRL